MSNALRDAEEEIVVLKTNPPDWPAHAINQRIEQLEKWCERVRARIEIEQGASR
jgi:hypothetical protein